jgi:hypothetical protein
LSQVFRAFEANSQLYLTKMVGKSGQNGFSAVGSLFSDRLLVVFDSQACSGAMKVIACIEDPLVIRKILDHLGRNPPAAAPASLAEPRAPPQTPLFDTL